MVRSTTKIISLGLIAVTFIDAELLEMIERADLDGDGEINPDEFYGIMTKKTFT